MGLAVQGVEAMAPDHHVARAMNLDLGAKAEVLNPLTVFGTVVGGCWHRERRGGAVHGKHVVGDVA
jgi:hypothetical protein